MSRLTLAASIALALASSGPTSASETYAIVKTARAGAVDGSTQNSDEFIWNFFIHFTAPADPSSPTPVVFETWASDADTFSTTPAWPAPATKRAWPSCSPRTSA